MNNNSDILIRQKMPPLGKTQPLQLKEPEVVFLDNGLKVFLINDESSGITRLDIVFEAGTAFQNKKLTASAVNKLLCEGTEKRSSFEISETFDYYGAYFEQFVNKDTAGITLYALAKYYDKLLPLIFETITEPVFSEKEITIYLEKELHNFKVNNEKVRYRAMLEFNRLMFGKNSAYGQTLTANDFSEITRADLVDFHKKYYSLQNSYIILSGTANDEMVKLLNGILGQHKIFNTEFSDAPSNFVSNCENDIVLIKRENALQSAIQIGYPALDKTDSEYSVLSLLNTLVGGYFGSRLMSSLREEKGLTYGIHSFVKNFKHGNYFAISTEVNANQTVEAVNEINRQIEKLKAEKISQNELQLVKNYMYGTFLRGFDGPFALSDRLKNVIDFNLTFDFYKNHLDKIMKTKAEELNDFAGKFFDDAKQKLLVVGNTAGL